MKDVEQSIREALDLWLKAFNSKDIEALSSYYDPEAVYANDGAPLMQGLGQIRPWFEQAFQMMKGTLLFQEEAVLTSVDMGVVVGQFCFRTEGEEDETGRVCVVFRRAADGRWLLVYDMDNRPPDVVGENF